MKCYLREKTNRIKRGFEKNSNIIAEMKTSIEELKDKIKENSQKVELKYSEVSHEEMRSSWCRKNC